MCIYVHLNTLYGYQTVNFRLVYSVLSSEMVIFFFVREFGKLQLFYVLKLFIELQVINSPSVKISSQI